MVEEVTPLMAAKENSKLETKFFSTHGSLGDGLDPNYRRVYNICQRGKLQAC